MNDKVDVLGRALNIGDNVLRTSSNYKGFYLDRITKFTPVMVRLSGGGIEHPSNLMYLTPNQAKEYR